MEYVCFKCGRRESVTTRKPKCDCGGLWTLDFTPPKFDLDLVDRGEWSMFRYRPFMGLYSDAWREISLGEGMTPVVRLDENVLLKMDYMMPTLSFKDRGAAVVVAHAKAIGVDKVVQDSSGNAGNAVAAYCARAGMGCEIFVPEGTSPKKIDMIRAHGATCTVVPGTRDHCADVCRSKVRDEGAYYANHVYNPMFYQGTKTYIYEIWEQLRRIPQHIFLPLGNGTLFLGGLYGLEHLVSSGVIDRMPTVVAIQSERCAPFAEAKKRGLHDIPDIDVRPTLAEGIAIGKPMRAPEILDFIYKYDIEIVTIPEEDILPARAALARRGVYAEHTTAGNYAAYLRYVKLHGRTPDSLITMCGAGLKSDH